MNWKYVLSLFTVVMAVGWFVPADEPASVPSEAADTSDEPFEAEQADGVELTRDADGHFYTEVDVNSGSVRFLVDTGATAVALTGDDARELGLYWSEDELGPVAKGANGMVRGKVIVIDRMQLGDVEVRNVRAAIIPEGLDVSLLGQTFLSEVNSVTISGNKMVLS
jgi:aspartyl protease family protein